MAGKTFEEMLQESFGISELPPVGSEISSDADTIDLRMNEDSSLNNFLNDAINERDQNSLGSSPSVFTQTIDAPTGPIAPPVKNTDVFEGNISDDTKLKQSDLLRPQNLNTIREYMIAKNGVDYETAEAETVVDDFVENMRWFNTNTVSTAGEVIFMNRASEREKAVAGQAYKLYDQLGSFWSNDGVYGRAEGIFDYVSAAVSDPSNYIGILTGGLAKAGTVTIAQGSKLAIKKAATEAAERALKSGAGKKAAAKAGEKAAKAITKIIEKKQLSGASAKMVREGYVGNAIKQSKAIVAQNADKLVVAKAAKTANRNALIATALSDGAVAYTHDGAIQEIFMEANYQEQYNRMQSLVTTAAGGLLGPLAQAGFGRLKGVSGFNAGIDKLDLAERTGELKDFLPLLEKKNQKKAVKVVREAYDSWAKKVQRGEAKLEGDILPERVFKDIILGVDYDKGITGGLTKIAADMGIKVNKKKPVGDVLTSLVKHLPEEDFMEISDLIHKATGFHGGDLIGNPLELGDVIASSINKIGKSLNTLSISRNKINRAVVGGNDLLLAATGFDDGKLAEEAITNAQPLGYAQNVWKRLLVSSPATTAANVAGFGAFAIGQAASDMLNSGLVGIKGAVAYAATGDATLLRQSKVYIRIQGQKIKNFADPLTTYNAYMKLLNAKPDVQKILFETVGTGVERSGGRFGIEAPNIEKVVGLMNDITGVRIQDSLTKSQMFMAEVDKYLDLKHGRTLTDVLAKGDLDLIDEEVTGLALDTTMKSVFAKDYTKKDTTTEIGKGFATLVERASSMPGVGFILPFGRFMNNVVASAYQFSPLSYAGMVADMSRKAKTPIQYREAFSRATVGTAALMYAAKVSEAQEEQGLDTFQLRSGSTILDVQNVYPLSYLLSAGKHISYAMRGKTATSEMYKDLGEQLAIGQVSRDIQFGTDVSNILDYFVPTGGVNVGGERTNIARDFYNAFTEPGTELIEKDNVVGRAYEFASDVSEGVGKPAGNIIAGFFRPLDPINRLVGFMTDTDTAKDTRQARGLGKFNQASTKYFDNILEALMEETDSITGESLRVASREGEIYDPNPLARIFGLKVVPGRTSTEKIYSMAGMKAWSKDQRSNIPAYDRIFNEIMSPMLERRMSVELNSTRFKEMDLPAKRKRVNFVVGEMRDLVKGQIQQNVVGQDFLQSLRYKATTNGEPADRIKAMKEMREEGIKANIKDFNYEELQRFTAKVERIKVEASGVF